jgi:hypothetical protein
MFTTYREGVVIVGAMIDILYLNRDDILILKGKYPHHVLKQISFSDLKTQRYRIIIPNIEFEEDYYGFLLDNLIAMSSTNFRSRLDSDEVFRKKMVIRAAAVYKKTS